MNRSVTRRSMVGGLALFAISALGTAARQATPTGSPVASPAASDVGKTVRYANFDVTLKSAGFAETVVPGSSVNREDARGKFLIVWLEITNTTLGPIPFLADDVTVADSIKRRFTVHSGATGSYLFDQEKIFPWDNFQPSIPYPYALVFDVAQDANGFTLHLSELPNTSFTLGI